MEKTDVELCGIRHCGSGSVSEAFVTRRFAVLWSLPESESPRAVFVSGR